MKIIQTNLFLVIFILIFTSCGFKVIDNQALNNFTIKNVETTGDKRINFKIKNNILINSNENGINQLLIILNTKKSKSIKEKNIKNEITKYELVINTSVKFNIINKDNQHNINFSVKGDYLVGDNYSSTLNNEKKLVENLVDRISKKILNEIDFNLNDN
tara:strand:- start:11 stop:487 length:477 start_codon:yes stop_codon:yes gene_type:complete